MKIGFDISDLATDRADGTTRYTAQLARQLPELATNHTWVYFAPFQSAATAIHHPRVTTAIAPFPKYWTQLRLPVELYRYRPEVLLMPIQQLPYLRPGKMKTVTVIHDLAFHTFPEQFGYKDLTLLHLFTAYAARASDHIIAVSKSTADDIAYYYGRTKNIHVVHHGVDHAQFRPPTPAQRDAAWDTLHQTYPTLRKPFLLFVGQIQPRKNIIRLVEAFESLRRTQTNLQLVIAGAHGWLQRPILDRIKRSAFVSDILLLGRVPERLLTPLYWHADVFVLPSLYEGFGMPILEAQASGCPVVTSNNSSLKEIVGDSAIVTDPLDVESISDGIIAAQRRREEVVAAGRQNAKEFSWQTSASQTLAVINQLM